MKINKILKNSHLEIVDKSFEEALMQVNKADLNIFSLDRGKQLNDMAEIAERTRISALFCSDSGFENAFV